jgi:surface polysaccharide O-acyltransferase-like enzyme
MSDECQRDEQLDIIRGGAMIWVVLIHCIYWTACVPAGWAIAKSYLLVEMPIFFYLAGASAYRRENAAD